MSVYRPLVGALWRTLEHYGVDPSLAIGPELYSPGEEQDGGRVSFDAHNQAQARAAALVNDAAFGLRAAEQIHPSHVGALGYAWLASSSLATAIGRLSRYRRMMNERLQLRVEEDDTSLTVCMALDAGPISPEVLADFQLGGLFLFSKMNFGTRLRPLRVTFRRDTPEDTSPWDEFFGTVIRFGAPEDSITFSREDVSRKLTVSDRALVQVHESVLERYVGQLDRTRIVGRARAMIVDQLPSGAPTADQVAAGLSMNTRTLHRKLAAEGSGFRSLLTEVRKDLAGRYVKDPLYEITEIAFMLGYSDSSAFSRAFRGWFGQSPTAARRGQAKGESRS